MDDTPLSRLINAALAERGWTPAQLHAAVSGQGATISYSGVYLWTTGGGVADKHRPLLADVLGLPLEQIARASAGMEPSAGAGA